MKKKIIKNTLTILTIIAIVVSSFSLFGCGSSSVVKIDNLKQFNKFIDEIESSFFQFNNTVELNADIDFNGATIKPIGRKFNFSGIFNGNNHTLSNFTLESYNNQVGLFYNGSNNAEIKNLRLKNVSFEGDNITNGGLLLANSQETKITNCEVDGVIKLSGNNENIGGICGSNKSQITNCKANVKIEVVNKSKNNEKSFYNSVGGIVGYSEGKIVNCVSNGSVEISVTEDAGNFENGFTTGGICGNLAQKGLIENCINNGVVKGIKDIGGICGYSGDGKIAKSVNNGKINGSIIKSCSIGGILGASYGVNEGENTVCSYIDECVNNGEIAAQTLAINQAFVGGILGSSYCEVSKCYNSGNIAVEGMSANYVGGIVGASENTVKNSYSICNISAISLTSSSMVGGVIGVVQQLGRANITNNYFSGEAFARMGLGGELSSIALCGGVMGYNMNDENTIKNNFFDKTVADAFEPSQSGKKIAEWYGFDTSPENIEGNGIANNKSFTTQQMKDKKSFVAYGEFVSRQDLKINSDNVWIFANESYPKLYFII